MGNTDTWTHTQVKFVKTSFPWWKKQTIVSLWEEKYGKIFCVHGNKKHLPRITEHFSIELITLCFSCHCIKCDKLLKSSLWTYYWIERSKCMQFPNAHTKLLYEWCNISLSLFHKNSVLSKCFIWSTVNQCEVTWKAVVI